MTVAVAPVSAAVQLKQTHRSMVEDEIRKLMVETFEAGEIAQARKLATWLDSITESADVEFESLISCI